MVLLTLAASQGAGAEGRLDAVNQFGQAFDLPKPINSRAVPRQNALAVSAQAEINHSFWMEITLLKRSRFHIPKVQAVIVPGG